MQFPETALLGDGLSLAVWGRRCEPDQVLREGDRLVRMVGAVLIALGVTALGLG